jgi:hypothetical protein
LLVADRAFCSYAHLAVLQGRGIGAVLRVHGSQRVDFTPGRRHRSWRTRRANRASSQRCRQPQRQRTRTLPPTSRWVKSLGSNDQIVVWFKPQDRPDWLSPEGYAALPEELTVRELRYQVDVPGFRVQAVTLVTTLLDAEAFAAAELQMLYAWRWRIETNFRHLKTTMKLEILKCQTVEGICKELAVFALAYNLVRVVMHAAACGHDLPVERISFVDALRWLSSGGSTSLQQIIVNPERPNRSEPRVRKRRPKPYPLMTKPRSVLRKSLMGSSM